MSILKYAPKFSPADAAQLAREHYNLTANANSLPSERDQNFLLQTQSGERFVLKIANATEQRTLLEAQNQVMRHLSERVTFCPRVLLTNRGDDMTTIKSQAGESHFVRLVTYLPGIPLGTLKYHSDELLLDIGHKIGQLTISLQEFEQPALHRDFHWDLANGLRIIRQNAKLILDASLRDSIQHLVEDFEKHTAPLLPALSQSIVHNDANDFNLLAGGGKDVYTRNQSMVGLIDFGDMVYSYTISDLAVAIAYAILRKSDPLAAAAQVVRGYHEARLPSEDELRVLFGLVKMRLCMSVCIAAEQQANQPENAYLGISQAPIRSALPKLASIPESLAEAIFRQACGLEPFPHRKGITEWLVAHAGDFASPLDVGLRAEPAAVLDLSMSSPLLSSDPDMNAEHHLTKRIQAAIAESGAQVGIGRYNEARYVYISPYFATGDELTGEYRTIHLGIDLFAAPGAPVYAPLEGKVIAFAENKAPFDYGAVILLEHSRLDQPVFYTLYGHLSKDSLKGLTRGQEIQKGQRLGTIGGADENGGWSPHLHFQIITDLLGLGTDFPGVALPSQREVWIHLCPDPNLILQIPAERFPPRDLEASETLARRQQRLGRNLSISYRKPLKIVRGWKQYLFDDTGRKYLDAYNNVAHVGHSHPRVIAAAQKQTSVLNTNTRYLHDNIIRYAERLTSMLPEPLNVCFFVNSGSEANELALRLARAYTHQHDMVVLEAAYHGNTSTLIDISPYKHTGPGGSGTPDWVHIAPIPDDYRGIFKRDDPQAGAKYARQVLDIIERLRAQGRGLAGFIAESLPSVGGQIIPPPGYLYDVYRYVREAGGVCIADEVQTGFGRVGAHFWGFEMQGVKPDIVVMGKPIGNGHPLAAVITTPGIAEAFHNGMEYFNTFGGNPVSCAIGLEVLNIVLEENLQEHARQVGEHMLTGLHPFVERYPLVGDVRGAGLFLGVELVSDRLTREPAAREAAYVADRMREHGILLGTDGPYHNVVKIRPPMPFNIENADFLITIMDKIFQDELAA